jgi:hypothetical protein
VPQILARLKANQESLRGLFPTSSGRFSRAASLTSSGPSVYSAFPRLTLSHQLITQHSPPIPPCMFDVSLPPTPPWTLSISSLPTPRSASDCRHLDAMDRSHHRCVCPAIDAVHCRSVWCFPDELRRLPLPPLPAGRRSPGRIEAASRRMRVASVCGMSTLDNSWGNRPAIRGTGEHREDPPGNATQRLSGRNDDRRMNELP